MVELLKVKDCFKYDKPKQRDQSASKTSYVTREEYDEVIQYARKCFNDCKNLLLIHERVIEILITAAKKKDIEVEIDPIEVGKTNGDGNGK